MGRGSRLARLEASGWLGGLGLLAARHGHGLVARQRPGAVGNCTEPVGGRVERQLLAD